MIQRIQTLFLVIGAGLLIAMLFSPMARMVGTEETFGYYTYISAFTLIIMSIVLEAVTIFSFKRRMQQVRLCILNSLVLLGLQIYLAVIYFGPNRDESIMFTLTTIFPVCVIILNLIAARYIARDEAMVVASTRLRSRKRK